MSKVERNTDTALPSPARRQRRLDIPSVLVKISLQDKQEWQKVKDLIIRGGISGVILEDSDNSTEDVYNAAIEAQNMFRGLPFIVGRIDVAAASGSGVILKQNDLPIVAAKRILGDEGALLIREVSDVDDARKTAEEGASALIISDWSSVGEVKSSQRGTTSIPVFGYVESSLESLDLDCLNRIDGLIGDIGQIESIYSKFNTDGIQVPASDGSVLGVLRQLFSDSAAEDEEKADNSQMLSSVSDRGMDTETSINLRKDIYKALEDLRDITGKGAPRLIDGVEGSAGMLLTDALKALDEAVLLVVVGEFNSGKSSVINSLLGEETLPVGVVPTTNEVCMLKFGEELKVDEREDGACIQTLPSQLLKEVTIVDTPGTNVIVERQQKLTEDFIPKADMVLFVLSADRPMTESETNFMDFIKQWGKKIVFAVNKKELLSKTEIDEVCQFVEKNASEILGVERPPVFPISAKMAAGEESSTESGFDQLFNVIDNILSSQGEAIKLKFNTALAIGQSLCEAFKQQIKAQQEVVEREQKAIESISAQITQFKKEMKRDAQVQYTSLDRILDTALNSTESLTDSILSLGNAGAIANYVLNADKKIVSDTSSTEILKRFDAGLKEMTVEHNVWLEENCNKQCEYYKDFLKEKVDILLSDDMSYASTVPSVANEEVILESVVPAIASEVLSGLSAEVLSQELEESIREAATSSFGTAGVSTLLTLTATMALNNIQEDLIALALGGGAAYLSILSIPLQRAKVKYIFRSKIKEQIAPLIEALKEDAQRALDKTQIIIANMTEPIEALLNDRRKELSKLQDRQLGLEKELQELQYKIGAL